MLTELISSSQSEQHSTIVVPITSIMIFQQATKTLATIEAQLHLLDNQSDFSIADRLNSESAAEGEITQTGLRFLQTK